MTLAYRYVFVGGLHRSGTSLVARLLEEHPDIAGISNAPVPENEGCYLQGAIPHTALHGIPGHFATDPGQHHIEGSRYDRLDTRDRLEADWSLWFRSPAPWRCEKSPVNLTRMRLYQALFPLAQFVVVVRRPEYVAAAMRKWSDAGDDAIVRYWHRAHQIVADDLRYLHAWLIVRYEDLVAEPEVQRRRLFAFLDLAPCSRSERLSDGNLGYPDATAATGDRSPFAYDGLSLGAHPLRRIAEAI